MNGIRRIHADEETRLELDARVQELLTRIRGAASDFRPGETNNQANQRQVEEFITELKEKFPGRCYEVTRPDRAGGDEAVRVMEGRIAHASRRTDAPVVLIERHPLRKLALRTTNMNYIFRVPGESECELVVVAHYDTWRGPGADDNTTGEEIVKQYLRANLARDARPGLTRTYFLAGSEECGLVGLMSQLLLSAGLTSANLFLSTQNWLYAALFLALCPLAKYRFGVSGSREYVKSLGAEDLARIKAVVAIDTVGEGRMYIPSSTLGADFVRAFIPFEGYRELNSVLQEGAHLHGIKYNSYIAGGTTDHVSFLEVNNSLLDRATEFLGRLGGARWNGRRKIPASALITMTRGKASPIVFGGKIHTKNDTADKVFPEPLSEALRILDYFFHILEGGERQREPRTADEYHYARVYEVDGQYYVALKDAVEPNRRNINAVYRIEGRPSGVHGTAKVREIVGWGVETALDSEIGSIPPLKGKPVHALPVEHLTLDFGDRKVEFERALTFRGRLTAAWQGAIGRLQAWMGKYTFLTLFLWAYLIVEAVDEVLAFGFRHWNLFRVVYFAHFGWMVVLTVVAEIAFLGWLIGIQIPTWIDNSYKHLNRADNLRSLKKTRLPAGAA